MRENNGFESVLKWAVIVIVAIVALKVLATVLGIAFVLGGILLFRVLPLVLLAWAVYRVIRWLGGKPSGTAAADL